MEVEKAEAINQKNEHSDLPGFTCKVVPCPKISFPVLLEAHSNAMLYKNSKWRSFLFFLPSLQQRDLGIIKTPTEDLLRALTLLISKHLSELGCESWSLQMRKMRHKEIK